VDAIGIYDAPVLNSTSSQALSRGVGPHRDPMPRDEREQKNVYSVTAWDPRDREPHDLSNLRQTSVGDSIISKTASRQRPYDYRVSEVFVVEPDAGWVLNFKATGTWLPCKTRMYPTFENRLINRADRESPHNHGRIGHVYRNTVNPIEYPDLRIPLQTTDKGDAEECSEDAGLFA